MAPERAALMLEDLRPTDRPVTFRLPDGSTMVSTARATLPGMQHLPKSASDVQVFPDHMMPHTSLLSLGQLSDAECTVSLTKQQVLVRNPDDSNLYRDQRNQRTRL